MYKNIENKDNKALISAFYYKIHQVKQMRDSWKL